MPIFPTQYSTLSAQALNVHLQQAYGLQNTLCRLLIRNVSDTYVLENPSSKYIFKIYRDAHRKVDEIRGEVELLNRLYEGGARVSHPIEDRQGQTLQRFEAAEGTRYGVLSTWAQGKVVTVLSDEQLHTLGTEMAAIHNITSTIQLKHYRKPYTIESTINQPLATLASAFTDLKEEYQYLTTTAQEVAQRSVNYTGPNFSYGYCHYDFLPKNFHFADDGQITFFDFDFAGEGLLANDIMSFFIHYFLDVHYGRISLEEGRSAFKKFVKAYRTVRSLTNDEIRAIPDLGFAFWVFYLGFQHDNYDDWSNLFFGPKFIKDRVALIKTWMGTASELLP